MSKEGKKMEKLDFDFDEIVNTNLSQSLPKMPEIDKKFIKSGVKLTYKLKNKFICKDLTDMSPEEFIMWVNFVAPGETIEISNVKSESSRLQIFNTILSYVDFPLFKGKSYK